MLPIFTTQQYDQTKLQPLGALFTQEVYPLLNPKASSGGIFGSGSPGTNIAGKAALMKAKMKEVTESLKNYLSASAREKYPDALAIIDVRFHFNEFVAPEALYIVGSAAGTAIKRKVVEPIPAIPQGAPMPPVQPFSQPLAMAQGAPMPMPMAMAAPMPIAPQLFSQPLAPLAPEPAPMAAPEPMPGQGQSQELAQQVQQMQEARGGKNPTRKHKKHPKRK